MAERIWYLKRCDFFERLSLDQLSRLEGRSRVKKYPRNSPIYLPADAADSVLLLAFGRARICNFTAEGKQAILAFIEQGELFGELALFHATEREEYAEAVEPSTVLLIPRDEMQRLMEEVPDVTLGITKLLGLRRRRIERRLKSLLFRSNREKLVHLLLELAEQYGKTTRDGLLIDIKLSHQDLANIIGSTRETVTTTLGELQSEGSLQIGRRTTVLTDVRQLAVSIGVAPPVIPAAKSGVAPILKPSTSPSAPRVT